MSEDIYSKVVKNKIQGMDREKIEMIVEIYESGDDFRTQTDYNTNRQQPLQSTGNECARKRCYRVVTVCLVLLCVLLLTAVIVLCVLINTNNQQCHNKTQNITEERDKLIAKYNDISYLSKWLNEKKDELSKQHCDGWIYYQSSCYFISSEYKNWTESRRYCRERGADLIIINNKEEQDFIKSSGEGEQWIGLSDSDEEGKWKWVDNSTLNTSFWRYGEPNDKTSDEDCVESYSSLWNDNSCYKLVKWICEKKIK